MEPAEFGRWPAAAEITPSGGGRHSGCEPEPPALHLKPVSPLTTH